MPLKLIIESGIKILGKEKGSEEFWTWHNEAFYTLNAVYGEENKTNMELKAFNDAFTISEKLSVIRALQQKWEELNTSDKQVINVNQSVYQNQSLNNNFVNYILMNIEDSSNSQDEKEEAKELLKQVTEELEKPNTNWDRVTNLLRRSFDYGLKIAPDIVKLADAYYRSKIGK